MQRHSWVRIFQDNQNSIMNTSDLTLKKIFDISAKLVSEQDKIFKVDSIQWEKTLMEISVIDWWRNNHQSSTRESLRLFRFCGCVLDRSINIQMQRSLEGKDWMDHNWSKLQRLWRNQWRADWIRLEHFPRIHHVAALWLKSQIYWAD